MSKSDALVAASTIGLANTSRGALNVEMILPRVFSGEARKRENASRQ